MHLGCNLLYPASHHVMSSVSWPLDSACVVFYRWSIATIRLSCTVMEIWSLDDFGVTTLTFLDHVTSSVTWPFNTPCGVSYRWSMVSMLLSGTVIEIFSLEHTGVTTLTFWGHVTSPDFATQPPRISAWTLYSLKVDSVGYMFGADSMRLSSFNFSWRAPKDARSTSRSAYWPYKVIRGRWFSCHLKGLCDFLLVINSNLSSISHRFWDTTTYRLKIGNFPYPISVSPPQISKCSLCTRLLKFCVQRAKTLG